MDLENLLNKEQCEAAITVDGPLLILAGAGSGKTRVLTYRIAHMIQDLNIYPSQILAITFTNKAAGEMKDRVRSLVGNIADNMWISTFHSSCVRILRREIDKLGYNKNFTIYDTYDQKSLIKQCMKELNINEKDLTDSEILNKISGAKNELISVAAFKKENEHDFRKNKIADIYALYQKKLKSNNALDFDDLIFKAVELLKNNVDVLDFYHKKFKYIMVDEYQDTNKAQYMLVKLLVNEKENICVVGDDDQCLPEGTILKGKFGDIRVEDLNEKDKILCASGNGNTTLGEIDKISKRNYCGPLVKVTTTSGKSIKATPNHITFARINALDGIFYVYLMYKKGIGYRVGQTQGIRSRKGQLISGLSVRLNGEQADKIWIIKACNDKSEASYYEQYYSNKYGIPTVVFTARGRRINLSQSQINKLFSEINSFEGADKLMEDNYLEFEHPHHFSSAVIRGDTIRKIVNLSFFSGRKAVERDYNSHRISLNTSGKDEEILFKNEGFSVRDGQRETWRIETERVCYDEAEDFAKRLIKVNDNLEIIRKAKLTEDKNFYFMPIGSLKEGMSISVREGSNIVEEKVEKVEVEDYSGYVYDLSVPNLRQYLANNVVMHNCIYAWRGADVTNILDFEKDYPSAKVVKLEQNYRSHGNILSAANEVIKNNSQRKDKALRTEKDPGDKINLYRAFSDRDEANFVASQIKSIMQEENKSYKDFAILYRMNSQSRIFEESFRKTLIPYKIVGGLKFYDRKEIKDIMAYLKLMNNPLDDIALKRIINVPKRNIGDATIQKIQEFATEIEQCLYSAILDVEYIPTLTTRNTSSISKFVSLMNSFMAKKDEVTVSQLIKSILSDTGYLKQLELSKEPEDESRVENIKELVSDAVEFERTSEDKSLLAFLEGVSLGSSTDADNPDEIVDTAAMMTVHSAKGLEFPVVFMVGMENGLFPGMSSLNDPKEMEESRRLCYVAITRAEEKLYITSAESRMIFGRTVGYAPSDFISEISEGLKEIIGGPKNRTVQVLRRNNTRAPQAYNPHGLMSSKGAEGAATTQDYVSVTGQGSNIGQQSMKSEATVGRKVRHDKFGVGTIVSVSSSSGDTLISIAFDNMGIKKLVLDKAPLEML